MIVYTVRDYMSQIVRIEVRLPNGHWAGEVTRNHPNLVLQIIETMPLGKGRGTAQIAAEQELLSDLGNLSGVETVNLLGDDKASVTIASGGGGFIRPLRTVGVVPRTPFDVIDGWADWTIQCSSEQAKQLVNEIELENLQMKLKLHHLMNLLTKALLVTILPLIMLMTAKCTKVDDEKMHSQS